MRAFSKSERATIRARFQTLPHPVRLVVFTQVRESPSCRAAHRLAEEIADCSELISLEVFDFVDDAPWARELEVDRIPSLALLVGSHDPFVRFYGAPAGYVVDALLDTIEIVAVRESGIQTTRRQALRAIPGPLHLRVLVGSTYPRCARVVTTAARLARSCEKLRVDVVELSEYPHLAVKWGVTELPTVVLDPDHKLVGPVSEDELFDLLTVSAA